MRGGASGVADFIYQFVHYEWRESGSLAGYHLPVGAVGGMDFGTIPDMSVANGDRPMALVWSKQLHSGAIELGRGDCREINTTDLMRDAWESALGFRPEGDKLVNLIADQFTRGSNPSGDTACKPLIPGLG